MAEVQFDKLIKRYGSLEVVHGIDLSIADGEFVVLVGPSGCGKSTCLRMVAGLEDVSAGTISIDGEVVNDMAPRNRDIGMVFQDYALYPHMKVRDNIGISLKYRDVPRGDIDAMVAKTADTLDLAGLLDRYPRELSGGQRQRVAMGRAIVRQPRVFLFDEPLSNLDAKLRVVMRVEIKKLHQQLNVTTIYVTHDQVEAMTLADRVVVMNAGHIEQSATPSEVYNAPESVFVAQFIGSPGMNLLPATADSEGTIEVDDGLIRMPGAAPPQARNKALSVGLRCEDIVPAADSGPCDIEAIVDVVEALGADSFIFATAGDHAIVARATPEFVAASGDTVRLRINRNKLHLFDRRTGRRVNRRHGNSGCNWIEPHDHRD